MRTTKRCLFTLQNTGMLAKLFHYLAPKLAPHIVLKKLEEKNFHARFDAQKRAYRYLLTKNLKTPFLAPYIACGDYGSLDALNIALKQFTGKHDFSMFKKEAALQPTLIASFLTLWLIKPLSWGMSAWCLKSLAMRFYAPACV